MVAAEAIEAVMKRIKREMKVLVSLGETLHWAAHSWAIGICPPSIDTGIGRAADFSTIGVIGFMSLC
jgi:hypothetical protein